MSEIFEETRQALAQALQLGDRVAGFNHFTPLLGDLPELDSMAVVTLVTVLEDRFGFIVEDDEISADTFETLGSLAAFVEHKLSS